MRELSHSHSESFTDRGRNLSRRLGLVALVLVLGLPGAAQSLRSDASIVSLRVRFGVLDAEPRSWAGRLDARNAHVVRLRNWRARPGDAIEGDSAWKLGTWQGPNFRYPATKPQLVTAQPVFIFQPGLILDVRTTPGGEIRFETEQGDFAVRLADVPPAGTLALLDGNVLVDRAATAERVTGDRTQNGAPSIVKGAGGELWAAWVAYSEGEWSNQVLARRFDGAAWGEPFAISPASGDVHTVQLGRDGNGDLWAVWSDQIDGNRDLYARRFDGDGWTGVERLTRNPQPDAHHRLALDSEGSLWLVWQGFRDGQADVFARRFDGTRWSAAERVSSSKANDWSPAIAADRDGATYVAWDTYDQGNYDVVFRKYDASKGSWSELKPIADSAKFEAHVSLACDSKNRLWAAWNESGTEWGKDNGYGLEQEGTRLYQWRSIATAVHDGVTWHQPVDDLNTALPEELRDYNDLPTLQVDGEDRPWIFFRHRTLKLRDVPSDFEAHRATWELYGIPFDGAAWGEPVALPFSTGRQDMRASFVVDDDGGLSAAWPTDGRDFQAFLFEHGDVYVGKLPMPAESPARQALRPRVQPKLRVFPLHREEQEDLARIRDYRIRSGGKEYRIFRGDTHRHTEFSMDGYNDGSLQEAYRYALDAASLDYLAVTEHNFIGGPEIEYVDWLLQQAVDLYMLPERFTTLFAYERSVRYPNGHRNILFAERGVRPFRISVEEYGELFPFTTEATTARTSNPEPVGTKDLYEYLKANDGIAIPHSPATGMGTDWRDNDPEVEPLVEIYQGDRVSAEYEGAPRAAHAGNPNSAPGGLRPAGFVWNAWAKGYKLGVQASSDHLSTHISFACTIAEDGSRAGLLDAMKRRHSYGATDNIILDFRLQSGDDEYLQGDDVIVEGDYRLSIRVIGTQPIRQIDVIRGQEFVFNRQNLGRDASLSFVDADPPAGETFYYVRVIQVDGQLAWSSPIWVKRR